MSEDQIIEMLRRFQRLQGYAVIGAFERCEAGEIGGGIESRVGSAKVQLRVIAPATYDDLAEQAIAAARLGFVLPVPPDLRPFYYKVEVE